LGFNGKLQASQYINGVLCPLSMAMTNHIVADVEFRCKLYLL